MTEHLVESVILSTGARLAAFQLTRASARILVNAAGKCGRSPALGDGRSLAARLDHAVGLGLGIVEKTLWRSRTITARARTRSGNIARILNPVISNAAAMST